MMKILTVDDDQTFLNIIQMMLKRVSSAEHTEIIAQSDSTKAIADLENIAPDVILLDLFMPGMNGWEFLDELKTKTLRPSVFILSSSVDPNDRAKAEKSELVKGFISKPPSFDVLKRVISVN